MMAPRQVLTLMASLTVLECTTAFSVSSAGTMLRSSTAPRVAAAPVLRMQKGFGELVTPASARCCACFRSSTDAGAWHRHSAPGQEGRRNCG